MKYPPPLMTSDPGSYARLTIVERKPKIIAQVIAENDYPPEIVANLCKLRQEIAEEVIKPLYETLPDCAMWNNELERYAGKTWLEVPWYFAETFFYRKILEAVQYFQPGQWFFWNPFHGQKERQMSSDVKRLAGFWDEIYKMPPKTAFVTLLHSALWGNRADLSNFTVEETDRNDWTTHGELSNILIDDTAKIEAIFRGAIDSEAETVSKPPVERVDFVNDNAGADVLFDLALSDFLLTQGWVKQIIFHLKNQPFFVSDAIPEDIHCLIAMLGEVASPSSIGNHGSASELESSVNSHQPIATNHEQSSIPDQPSASQILSTRLQDHLQSGKLVLKEDPFWTSPFMFRQMPAHLIEELQKSNLVILKGDVNYRRLLDDLHWEHTTKLEDITSYFPAPFATLRTLKGEIMVGLQPDQAEAIARVDPTWLINGKRGIIQYVGRTVSSTRQANSLPYNAGRTDRSTGQANSLPYNVDLR